MSAPPRDLPRRRALRSVAALGALGATAAAPAAAPPASTLALQVDLGRSLGATRPTLVGSNTPWVHAGEAMVDAQGRLNEPMLAAARELAPPLLRYPGTPDTYHWRQGVGPLARRPLVAAAAGVERQRILLGTRELLELCDELGAEPLIELNLHDGEDEALALEAADWLRHVNEGAAVSSRTGRRLPRVRWWELGNEPYLKEPNRPDGRPDPHFLTPAQYARRVNRVMAALRQVDPTLRPGLPFATDTWSGRPWTIDNDEVGCVVGPQIGYARTLLDRLERPQDLGFLALHYYQPLLNDVRDKQGRRLPVPDDERLYWAAMAGAESVRGHLGLVRRTWREHPRTAGLPMPPVFVTEFHAFFTDRHDDGREAPSNAYIASHAGAMFVADLLRVLALEPDVGAALHWSLSRNWHFGALSFDSGADGTRFFGRPVADVLRSARALLAAGGTLRPVDLQTGRTERAARALGFTSAAPGLPLATALASQHGTSLQLLVIHKDLQRPTDVTLRLTGAAARGTARVSIHAAPQGRPFHAPGRPEAVERRTLAIEPQGRGTAATWTWRLPPASWAWVRLDLA